MTTSSYVTKEDLKNVLNEVLPPTPSEYKKLLWTNPNPTANFSAQTVSIDLSDYDEVEVVTIVSRTSGKMGICHLYFTSPVSQSLAFLGDDATKHARDLSINTSGITFQNGYYQYMTSGQSKTTDSGQAIPYKIYGIKYERVSPPQEEIADYIVEQGTDNNFSYTKYASGRLEAERIWNVGQVTLNTTEVNNVRVSATINISQPSNMVNGTVVPTYIGNSSNSPTFMETISSTEVRIAKFASTNVTLQNVTFALRLVNGTWK